MGPGVTAGDTVAGYRLDLTRLLYMFYMDMEQQLARADIKANLILTANSILLAAMASFIAWRTRGADLGADIVQLLLMLTPALIFSLLAAYFALSVAYPRLIAPDGNAPGRMFQSTAMASMPLNDYVSQVLSAELDTVKREVLCGMHAKACILQVKFHRVRYGIRCTIGAFLTTLGCLMLVISAG